MIKWLVKIFIKDADNINDQTIRQKYGTLSSIVGIICNITLFIVKIIMGTLANSISIISDAYNNLSDSASCIIALLGYKMSAKPADKDHPFGHGRMEYLTSLLIAVVIMLVGLELLQNSVAKIIHPETVTFSWVILISLIISILLKFWMSRFNRTLGNKINSAVMLATSKDSRNDVVVTSASILALLSSIFTDLPVDGVMGILVSLFILFSGFGIIKDTVDVLLGKPADAEVVKQLKKLIMDNEYVLGMHDLIIHNYGPGKLIGSAHVEVNADKNILDIHDAIDTIEKAIYEQLKIVITLHMDPVEINNTFVNECHNMVEGFILDIHRNLSIHDFRVVTGPTHTNLIFDILVPFDCDYSDAYIQQEINKKLSGLESTYYTVITFDRSFIEMQM